MNGLIDKRGCWLRTYSMQCVHAENHTGRSLIKHYQEQWICGVCFVRSLNGSSLIKQVLKFLTAVFVMYPFFWDVTRSHWFPPPEVTILHSLESSGPKCSRTQRQISETLPPGVIKLGVIFVKYHEGWNQFRVELPRWLTFESHCTVRHDTRKTNIHSHLPSVNRHDMQWQAQTGKIFSSLEPSVTVFVFCCRWRTSVNSCTWKP
jgi:hypothetical protein